MMTYELDGCLEVIIEKLKTIREKHNSPALVGHLVKNSINNRIVQITQPSLLFISKITAL